MRNRVLRIHFQLVVVTNEWKPRRTGVLNETEKKKKNKQKLAVLEKLKYIFPRNNLF